MEVRRGIRKQLLVAQSVIRNRSGLSPEYYDSLVIKLDQLKQKLQLATCTAGDPDLIISRRKELSENVPLYDIFTTLWHLFSENNCPDNFLTKDAYFAFHKKMQYALIGSSNTAFDREFDLQLAELDWTNDNQCYGALYRVHFYDLMFELVETWSTVLSSKYYAAFSWALLDSVADVSKFPPRLRANGDIQCIMKCSNGSENLENFRTSSKQRIQLTITGDYLLRVPEIQKRIRSRREGVSLDRTETDMVHLVGLQVDRERRQQQKMQLDASLAAQQAAVGTKKGKIKKGQISGDTGAVGVHAHQQRHSRRFSNVTSIYDEPASPGKTNTDTTGAGELFTVTEDEPEFREATEGAHGSSHRRSLLISSSRAPSLNRTGFGSSSQRGLSERERGSLLNTRSDSSMSTGAATGADTTTADAATADAAPLFSCSSDARAVSIRAMQGHRAGHWTPGMLDHPGVVDGSDDGGDGNEHLDRTEDGPAADGPPLLSPSYRQRRHHRASTAPAVSAPEVPHLSSFLDEAARMNLSSGVVDAELMGADVTSSMMRIRRQQSQTQSQSQSQSQPQSQQALSLATPAVVRRMTLMSKVPAPSSASPALTVGNLAKLHPPAPTGAATVTTITAVGDTGTGTGTADFVLLELGTGTGAASATATGRARRQTISNRTSYAATTALAAGSGSMDCAGRDLRLVSDGTGSRRSSRSSSPCPGDDLEGSAYIDWADNGGTDIAFEFGGPGLTFQSGLGSNHHIEFSPNGQSHSRNQSPTQQPTPIAGAAGAGAGAAGAVGRGAGGGGNSPDTYTRQMYTTLSAPVLIPAYPRRDTARVNIAMIRETDAILVAVGADNLQLEDDPLGLRNADRSGGAASSNGRPVSPSRRGMAGDVTHLRKTQSAQASGREEFSRQFEGKDQSLMTRTLTMPGQFDATEESLALLSTTAKPLVSVATANKTNASVLRKNYGAVIAQRAQSPGGVGSPLNANIGDHSSSVLELASDGLNAALGLVSTDPKPTVTTTTGPAGDGGHDNSNSPSTHRNPKPNPNTHHGGTLDLDMNDDDSTQVGEQADITRSVLERSWQYPPYRSRHNSPGTSRPASRPISRPHSPKYYDQSRPATSATGHDQQNHGHGHNYSHSGGGGVLYNHSIAQRAGRHVYPAHPSNRPQSATTADSPTRRKHADTNAVFFQMIDRKLRKLNRTKNQPHQQGTGVRPREPFRHISSSLNRLAATPSLSHAPFAPSLAFDASIQLGGPQGKAPPPLALDYSNNELQHNNDGDHSGVEVWRTTTAAAATAEGFGDYYNNNREVTAVTATTTGRATVSGTVRQEDAGKGKGEGKDSEGPEMELLRPHTASEAELRKAVSFSALIVANGNSNSYDNVDGTAADDGGAGGKTLKELAGIDQMRASMEMKLAEQQEEEEIQMLATQPSSLFRRSSTKQSALSSKQQDDSHDSSSSPKERPSLFASRLKALKAVKRADATAEAAEAAATEAARPSTAPAHLTSPGGGSVVSASAGVSNNYNNSNNLDDDLMSDSIHSGNGGDGGVNGGGGSLASGGSRRRSHSPSSVNTLNNFTGNAALLPVGTVVHQPGLVVSSRYSSGPVNLNDDFRSPPGKSGSALRTYSQDRSDTVTVPVTIRSTTTLQSQRMLSGFDDMSLDLCLGPSVVEGQQPPMHAAASKDNKGKSNSKVRASAGGKGKGKAGITVLPSVGEQQEGSQQQQQFSSSSPSSDMLKRLMNRAKERKPPPKEPISFVRTQKPWIPDSSALTLIDHDNSNQTLGYNNHILIRKHELDGTLRDSSTQNQVIRQQNRLKSAFEQFATEKLRTETRSYSFAKVATVPLCAHTKKVPMNLGPKRI